MLQNASIKLRAPEPNDIDFLFALENDTRLWHVTQTLVPFSRFDMEQYVFSADKQDLFATRQARFMIELVDLRDPIGAIDLFDVDALNRRAGVGIVITESHRDKGYAGMALDLMTAYAFEHLNLHQLFCHVEADNLSSVKLFEKHGFQRIGLKKDWNLKNGHWVGEYLMQRLR